jgi:hypothetical protein
MGKTPIIEDRRFEEKAWTKKDQNNGKKGGKEESGMTRTVRLFVLNIWFASTFKHVQLYPYKKTTTKLKCRILISQPKKECPVEALSLHLVSYFGTAKVGDKRSSTVASLLTKPN